MVSVSGGSGSVFTRIVLMSCTDYRLPKGQWGTLETWYRMLSVRDSQSGVHGPASSISITWELTGNADYLPYPKPTESETGGGPSNLCEFALREF